MLNTITRKVTLNRISIISGGQSGTDRAALDFALQNGIPCGGWCPQGRWAEDGSIPGRYPLRETAGRDPASRTRKNVEDSDGVLIICIDKADEGSRLTEEVTIRNSKPLFRVNGPKLPDTGSFTAWLDSNKIEKLNIAGPRESNSPGIYAFTTEVLKLFFGG